MNRCLRNVAKCTVSVLALCALVAGSSSTLAITQTWTQPGNGNFNDGNNWSSAVIPGAGDFVSFEILAGFPYPYTVTFPGNQLGVGGTPTANYTTSHLRVRDNGVTFSGSTQAGRGPSAYMVASTTQTEANRGIIIGLSGGENASLNLSHNAITGGGFSSLSGEAATIGDDTGARGTLNMNVGAFNVTGASSSEYNLIVGNRGTGSIHVNNGTDLNVSVGKTSLGNHDTGVGTVSVSGAGSTWFQGFTLDVGREGRGAITVQNGASFNGAITFIGDEPSGTGTVTVTGNGSTWNNNSGGFLVGVRGQGFLNILDGGVMNGHTGALALASSGVAAAVVTGSGSRWNNSGSVWVGGGETGPGGDATLNVSDGAVVAVGHDVLLWPSGTLDGDGTIEGHVRNEGIVAPGNSSGVLTVTGNYTQRNSARYLVEIFGPNQGNEYDLLDVGGSANLAGTLDVDFGDDDYTPALGDTFEILKATAGVVGSFDNASLPAIGQNVRLATIYGPSAVTLAVVPIQTGDFSGNGVVDAADYVVWRRTQGQTGLALAADGDGNGVVDNGDFAVWRSHFGETPAITASGTVPEPTTAVLVILASVLLLLRNQLTKPIKRIQSLDGQSQRAD